MIILRDKYFSINSMIDRVVAKLDRDGIEDFEVSSRIPKDCISVTSDLNNLLIYIPLELEYSQYGIDDFLRSLVPYMRTSTSLDRNLYKMKLSSKLNEAQYIKLVKYIIKEEEYCVIVGEEN